ncbi:MULTISPECIES: hypothetical protein [Rhizobium/Agrobacterium group]|jgi:hypothetical protein|uniref:hypothetical protein n=1 Tax=Rhizobium/Agrobacterium group TaxID=227290 RepID=UPI00110D8DC4|nr:MULTISPECIES: hypothetical protein [Rhizobium/Agrobacterium group]NWJ23514.1 hypothetical protein [Rhizobium sp. RM]TMV19281.1 hypothetical protein BJG94_14360 [Rhizobium sp. Td3]UXS04015.1 hypothetical protein FY156_21115 [Agrobacterium tumefaciens]
MTRQVIEYAGIAVGIVVPDNGLLKFIAVKFHVHDLDGRYFASPAEVLRAIHKLVSTGNTVHAASKAA